MKGEYMKEFKEDKKNLEMEIQEKIEEFNKKYNITVKDIDINYSIRFASDKILSVKLDIEL
jgi:hypothetical protein